MDIDNTVGGVAIESTKLLGLLKEARDELQWFNEDWQHRQGSMADGGVRRVVRLIQKIDAVISKPNARPHAEERSDDSVQAVVGNGG